VSERDDVIALVSRHLALWSVKDEDLRLREINDVYGEEIEVIEPTGLPLGPGRLGLHKHIGMLQKLLGDFTFELDSDIDTHHGWATYAWIHHSSLVGFRFVDESVWSVRKRQPVKSVQNVTYHVIPRRRLPPRPAASVVN
jgi:hypothetical protein